MDYETKPTSRDDLRRYSAYFRELFDVPKTGAFPVLEALDKVNDVFEGSNYIIVEDDNLPPQTMAQCSPNDAGGFTIEIKESVYNGAYEHSVGACLGFICHEICHIFLFEIPESFEFCFEGVEQHSIVAVGMIGCKHSKDEFLVGYNEMLSRIEPEAVICFGTPFPEMEGNIIIVDYLESRKVVR